MKTERITVLGSTEFKAFLSSEAEKAGLSVSELVRQRCEQKPGEDELLLASLGGSTPEPQSGSQSMFVLHGFRV